MLIILTNKHPRSIQGKDKRALALKVKKVKIRARPYIFTNQNINLAKALSL